MARSLRVLVPSAALLAWFTACGGVTDPGLFSGSSGSSASGESSVAGSAADAGSSSVAGSVGVGGNDAEGGESSGGSSVGGSDVGGSSSGGEQGHAGHSEGGSAGHSEGGSAGHAEGGSAGHAEGGGAGHAEGGGAGHAEGGAGAGGKAGAGSGGKGGSAGAAGGGGDLTCKDLLAQASAQLETARACNLAQNVLQCTGKVNTTCGCQVPVERADSPATQAYEATLKQINAKHCVQVCPAIACFPASNAQCRPATPGSVQGSCVASLPVPTPN